MRGFLFVLAVLIVLVSVSIVSAVDFDYVVGIANHTYFQWDVVTLDCRDEGSGLMCSVIGSNPSYSHSFPKNVFIFSAGPYSRRFFSTPGEGFPPPPPIDCSQQGFLMLINESNQQTFSSEFLFPGRMNVLGYPYTVFNRIDPIMAFGDKAEFIDLNYYYFNNQCWHSYRINLDFLENPSSRQQGFVSVLDDIKYFSERVIDLTTPVRDAEYTVVSTKPDIKVMFSDSFSDITSDISAVVLACVDADHDDECDLFEEDPDEVYCDNLPDHPLSDYFEGFCCGYGDYDDCNYYSDKNAFCGNNTADEWSWAVLAEPGIIADLSAPDCVSGVIVSDGSKFYYCGTDIAKAQDMYSEVVDLSEKVNINGHDYVCKDNKIIECGGTDPRSRTALIAGDFIVLDSKTNFCNAGGVFSTDIIDETSCINAGFNFSGTKCCGEPDSANKNYEDSLGGCLDNVFIPAGSTVPDNDNILNDKGNFTVCNPNSNYDVPVRESFPFFANIGITPFVKGPCGSPLLNVDFSVNNAVCMPFGSWYLTDSPDSTLPKKTAWSDENGCCSVDDCWNGDSCTVDGDYFKSDSQGFKCEAGFWTPVALKFSWDKSSSGFCSSPSQCLVNDAYNDSLDNQPGLYFDNLGSPNLLPKCIDDKQFILDYYCNEGLWSSRTNLIAQQLLAVAFTNSRNDFSLYCDSFDNALNNFDYIVSSVSVLPLLSDSCMIGNLVNQPCVNNFCVLKYGNNVAFGVSLNKPVVDDDSFLRTLDKSRTYCNNAVNNNGLFTKCGDNIWYNHDTESIIQTSESFLPAITSTINSFFNDNFNDVNDFVFSDVHSTILPEFDYSFFNASLPLFNFVYFSQKNTKSIFGFKEKTDFVDFAGWNFNNVNLPSNFCLFIRTLGGECKSKNSNVFIVGKKEGFQQSIVDYWSDLSGKLRLV